jgi:iron complex transport system substrate-binding protein
MELGTRNLELAGNSSELTRVVSLQPSATTVLAALGVLDRLVACTKYCVDVCPEAATKTIVEDSWSAQATQIVDAKPHLVIASVPYQLEAVAEILKAGIRFLGLAPRTLADIYTDIAAIAGLMGVADRGQRLVRSMQEDIEDVRTTSARAETRPRVFCEEWGKPVIASQPWVAELIEAAGGEFVGTPGKHTTAEQVAAEMPDVIVAAWCGAGDRVPLEKIVSQRNWNELAAVLAGRVYCLNDEFLNTPGPTLVQGLHALAYAMHPELFPAVRGVRRINSAVIK